MAVEGFWKGAIYLYFLTSLEFFDLGLDDLSQRLLGQSTYLVDAFNIFALRKNS